MIGYVANFIKGDKVIRKEATFTVTIIPAASPGPGPGPGPGPVPNPTDPDNPDNDNTPDWTDRIESDLIPDDPDNVVGDRPIPFIRSLSDTGLLTIGWDRLMQQPPNYTGIPDEQIAISDWSAFSKEDVEQRLDFGVYSYPGEETGYWFAIINALEVRIIPSVDDIDTEPQPINFTWSMISFSGSQLQI